MTRSATLMIAASLAGAAPANAAIRFVDATAPAGGSGAAWPSAFQRLQDALAISTAGDEIRVAQGLYKPAAPGAARESAFFMPDNTTIRGAFAGLAGANPDARDPALFITTLSGDLNNDDLPSGVNRGENCFHVVSARNLTIGVTLDGVRVIAGNANGVANPQGLWDRGGGVHTQINPAISTGPTLRLLDCTLEDNDARNGAGCGTYNTHLRAESCLFQNNRAQVGGGYSDTSNNTVLIRHDFLRCRFEHNRSTGLGGAAVMCMPNQYDLNFTACRFTENTASGGGAIYTTAGGNAHGHAVDCIFERNTANDGVAWFDDFTTNNRIINCTIVDNVATGPVSAAIVSIGLDMQIANCILRNPGVFEEISGGALINVRNSNLKGGFTGPGNIDADPLFRNQAGSDYRLRRASPCADAGANADLPADTLDLDADGNTAEPTPLDFAGANRTIDDPASAPNALATVDMGALERQICPGDATDDLLVNFADLNTILSQFGQSGAIGALTGDITGDGAVTFADLNLVLSRFAQSC